MAASSGQPPLSPILLHRAASTAQSLVPASLPKIVPNAPGQPRFAVLDHACGLQVLSSILYLSGDPTMGPTIFLEGVGAGRGWRMFPLENRYVAFKGGLLHGVLPAAREAPHLSILVKGKN